MKAAEGGATEKVLNSLRLHKDNLTVCKYGCDVLWNLKQTEGKKHECTFSLKPHQQKQIGGKKAKIDSALIAELMDRHIIDPDLFKKGCEILCATTDINGKFLSY